MNRASTGSPTPRRYPKPFGRAMERRNRITGATSVPAAISSANHQGSMYLTYMSKEDQPAHGAGQRATDSCRNFTYRGRDRVRCWIGGVGRAAAASGTY